MNGLSKTPGLRKGLVIGIHKNAFKAHADKKRFQVCRTAIPRAVWKSEKYSYVGLEIYLPDAGMGQKADWIYAAGLVEGIIKAKRKT
ncbi:hypothetical protein DSCA_39480 [Desulfosarcina alkanivorans]|jgi:hypothetical protein|uniref:Uncharacterized protein n=2 Tax=Desulfosarcina alkanivorans TaxID=571177 RepID=A0A5K7YMH7_9BACT|nr:hypothetical protein DSCA_39480 [Desulfosarcina alkanivorans]